MIYTHELSTASSLQGPAHTARTAALVAESASRALLTELMLTPKPGLVDQRNSGAHRDMNLSTFLTSARVLTHSDITAEALAGDLRLLSAER